MTPNRNGSTPSGPSASADTPSSGAAATSLPVLFVPDLVVLPGMVVPVELDESSRAAVDAARAGSDSRLLIAPRLSGSDDRYPLYGAVATVERVGRFSGGGAAAVLKAERRGRIGSGVHRSRSRAVGRGRPRRRARHRARPRAG